jgi:hypothetical protein
MERAEQLSCQLHRALCLAIPASHFVVLLLASKLLQGKAQQ